MQLIPSIDLRGGHSVRLFKGDFSRETRYELAPRELLASYAHLGATWLHVVDLDGALDRRATDHEAIHADSQQIVHDRIRAQAAADLHLQRALRRERNNGGAVGKLTVARAIEIDDVEPVGAHVAVLVEKRARIGVVARLGIEIAAQQPDTAAAPQVDGGNEAHQ